MPLCSRMVGGSVSKEINAPPEIVWKVATDMEQATRILTNLKEQEIINTNTLQVGSVVRKVRTMIGKEYTSFLTVTSMNESLPYSISNNIYVSQAGALEKQDQAARTASWTIVEGSTLTTNFMIMSYSIVPDDWRDSIFALFCGRCIVQSLNKDLQQDLEDFCYEAEKRQRRKDVSKK